jgi:hypothetical protein
MLFTPRKPTVVYLQYLKITGPNYLVIILKIIIFIEEPVKKFYGQLLGVFFNLLRTMITYPQPGLWIFLGYCDYESKNHLDNRKGGLFMFLITTQHWNQPY